jgi:lysophospholipase L1-like esterase
MIIGTQAGRTDLRNDTGFIKYNEIIKSVSNKYNIPLFNAYTNMQDDKYFLDNVHLTSEGVEKISELIYTTIKPIVEEKSQQFKE